MNVIDGIIIFIAVVFAAGFIPLWMRNRRIGEDDHVNWDHKPAAQSTRDQNRAWEELDHSRNVGWRK